MRVFAIGLNAGLVEIQKSLTLSPDKKNLPEKKRDKNAYSVFCFILGKCQRKILQEIKNLAEKSLNIDHSVKTKSLIESENRNYFKFMGPAKGSDMKLFEKSRN